MMTTATVTKTTLTSVTLKAAPIIDMGNIKLPQVTYKGQPVLTARAVAEVLGTDRNNVQQRFMYNRKDFKEGVDYFKVTAAEAKAMGFAHSAEKIELLGSNANLFRYSGTGVTLFTRRGALFLARYVTSPEALELYNTAMDAYFTLEGIATGSLSTREEAAQKAHEVVAKGASLLPGINLQLAGKNAPKAFATPLNEAESLLKAALVSIGRAIGSNNMLERQKEELEGQLRAASMSHAGTAALTSHHVRGTKGSKVASMLSAAPRSTWYAFA
ncbi:ORF6N domain-containing protein [Laribacter hongkongensis]|uniref:ORF6N domain-containing protein n=1 Tax=Laribacter hongkongensis TaxID=168471 RepID=UPI001EFCFB64|nr:ORF6N domain-containing protein [Laribacter hongkongensis]MCG9055398.1 ORF6N domain-containing protein [Laribacter hongkongensis]